MNLHSLRHFVLTGVIALLMGLSFVAGIVTGSTTPSAIAADLHPEEFEIFWEAWNLVETHFVDQDKIDVTTMTYGAIDGMLNSLGDEGHTTFLSPREVEEHEMSLSSLYEGIGAYVVEEDGRIRIVTPIAGSPAEAAGVLAGDEVIAVDGEPVDGLSLNEVVTLIRGPANTEVTLTVQRPDRVEPVDILIVRQPIEVTTVTWQRVPETAIAYLQITQFSAKTGQELETALLEMKASERNGEPLQGIILDLRNNPGGYLSEAIRTGSQFLQNGSTILIEADAEDNQTVYRSEGRGLARELPVAVLINEGTASAGEITAGAIQENDRGTLIGQTTFGTGTVLNRFGLSDGSAILLGVTNWLTPEGNLIKGQGIVPDVTVELSASTVLVNARSLEETTLAELLESDDLQFLRALEQMEVQAPQPTIPLLSAEGLFK